MNLSGAGVDIAKSVFHVHAVDRHDRPQWRTKLKRAEWLEDHPETSVTTGTGWLLWSCTYPEGARDEEDSADPPQPRAVA